jgi:hypothetical protein
MTKLLRGGHELQFWVCGQSGNNTVRLVLLVRMGSAASTASGAGVKASVSASSVEDLKTTFSTLSPAEKQKMMDALCEPKAPQTRTLHVVLSTCTLR